MEKKVRPTALFILFLFLPIFMVTQATAEVVDFSIKPENPVKGDVVTVYGTASPNEEVKISISFEKTVSVHNGEYVYSIDGVKIPESKNGFTVTAYGCDDLKVSVSKWFKLIWITLSSDAINGVATVSQSNVPTGTYDVTIHGKSSKSSVRLKIVAIGYIKADSSGKFSYSYETSSMPLGEFVVSAGGLSKTVTLLETAPPTPTATPKSGGGGSVAPTSTPLSASTPIMNNTTPIPTKTQISAPTPTKTPTTNVTPQPSMHPTQTPVQTPTVADNTNKNTTQQTGENKTEKPQKVSKSIQIPGFDFIAAMISFTSAIFVFRRLMHS